MVCNLVELDGFVRKNILEKFELSNLNTLAEFGGMVPTTENLCTVIHEVLEKGFKPARIEKVRLEETMLNSFEYAGGRELRT